MNKSVCLILAFCLILFTFASCSFNKNVEEQDTTAVESLTQTITEQDSSVVENSTEKAETTVSETTQTTTTTTTTTKKAVTTTSVVTTQVHTQAQTTAVNKPGSFSSSDAAVNIKGQRIKANTDYNKYASALGNANSVQQAPSCHYSGMDNIYYYSGFTIYTYLKDSQEIIYDIEVTSSSYKTTKGVKVGDSVDTVKQTYGAPAIDTADYIEYQSGGTHLAFYISGSTVNTIEISVD